MVFPIAPPISIVTHEERPIVSWRSIGKALGNMIAGTSVSVETFRLSQVLIVSESIVDNAKLTTISKVNLCLEERL